MSPSFAVPAHALCSRARGSPRVRGRLAKFGHFLVLQSVNRFLFLWSVTKGPQRFIRPPVTRYIHLITRPTAPLVALEWQGCSHGKLNSSGLRYFSNALDNSYEYLKTET